MSYIPGYTSLSSVRRCTYSRPAPSRHSTEENRCSSRRRRTSRRVAWPITRSCSSTTSRSSSPGSISSTFLSPRGDTSPQAEKAEIETPVINEPLTVIFSRKGWVRARQGWEVDPTTLSFKEGDELLALL